MKIYIDADACPVPIKEILYKASARVQVELVLVANQYMRFDKTDITSLIVVSEGADEADNKIVELMEEGDLVITADIPLADRAIKKGGVVLDPLGEYLTKANIGPRLAMRNFMDELRQDGVQTVGPKAFGNKEKQAFAQKLDQFLTKNVK